MSFQLSPVLKSVIQGAFLVTLIITLSCNRENSAKKDDLSLEDYQRAESFLAQNTDSLVLGKLGNVVWHTHQIFSYTLSTKEGDEYFLTDVQNKSSNPLFDQILLAQNLSSITSEKIDPFKLNIKIERTEDGIIDFRYKSSYFRYSTSDQSVSKLEEPKTNRNEFISPDGKKAIFTKEYNLYVKDLESGAVKQITYDGTEDYGYATDNAGWTKSDRPVLLWSPQSDKIATFKQDSRGVKDMYLWNTKVGHPDLEKWKYPLPGDSNIFMIERMIVDISGSTPKIIKLKMDADPQRSTTTDHIADRDGSFLDVEWSSDGEFLSFVSSSRDHKIAHFQTADPKTGDVRSVYQEVSPTYFESGDGFRNWHILSETNELLWYSESSNWGHLYLHDLSTGELKNAVTSGEWAVQQVHYIDKDKRKVYFIGSNKEEGNPYFNYLYSVNLDGSELTLLTPEKANHQIQWSPDFQHFVDTYSTPVKPAVSALRTLSGETVMELSTMDISSLQAAGWVPPVEFEVLARDSVTKLYGLMYKPTNFDPDQSYPILNYLYPGPQSGSVGSRSFMASRRDKQAVAELGFIVVEIDAMGTPGRSKSFHDAYYGNMGDNGLPDQITAIKQLAAENSWMDIDRVGIWGHSGGGFASTAGILRYPDFYKVAVSSAGNHDNRNYEDDWGEKWHGLLVEYGTTLEGQPVSAEVNNNKEKTNYDNQANQLLAENLKGNLLIAHGLMDNNVHPSNTLLVVQALIKADKDFDMVMIPDARHGFANSRFFMKKRWDYFVRHLIGVEPPADFVFEKNIP